MRRAQGSLADFLPLIDWVSFRRAHLGNKMRVSGQDAAAVACADDSQAVVWLVRRDTIGPNGMLRAGAAPVPAALQLPGLARGTYRVIAWDTAAGRQTAEWQANSDGWLKLDVPPFSADVALAIRGV